ncbi:hypothetical protein [Streptomyces halstedii]|uniref:hypothetical protein n=1 Tax=Streptomyces halstedii TaxID=1944 RepID=UPI003647997A
MILRAFGLILDRNPGAQLGRLSSKLAGHGKKKPLTVAQWKETSISDTVGGSSSSRSMPLAKIIVAAYNDGLEDPTDFLSTPGRPG